MKSFIYFLFVLPFAFGQFPGLGLLSGRFQNGNGNYGGGFGGNQGSFTNMNERSYYVRGRLVCGIQGADGARVSLWEKRGAGTPFVYEEKQIDASGSFYVKAEIRNGGGGWNGGNSNGYLTLTINHNCGGQRQMSVELPPSYFNQGIVAIKTFDLGTINLEGRFSGEETNAFMGGGNRRGNYGGRFGSGSGGGFGSGGFGGGPVSI